MVKATYPAQYKEFIVDHLEKNINTHTKRFTNITPSTSADEAKGIANEINGFILANKKLLDIFNIE